MNQNLAILADHIIHVSKTWIVIYKGWVLDFNLARCRLSEDFAGEFAMNRCYLLWVHQYAE